VTGVAIGEHMTGRRINEVLSLLVAAGIETFRTEDKSGTKITVRKTPKNDATDAIGHQDATGQANGSGDKDADDATANATAPSNTTRKPADKTECGDSGNSGNRFGDFADEACTPEQAGRIRKLVEDGMKEKWAREAVLGKGWVES
jgi:hypothetical protein